MTFEKWQALGNDYLIVEQGELPFELTAERVRRLCAAHTGVGSDGVLVLCEPTQRGYVARLRIFNPDGSEAELSGNGAARPSSTCAARAGSITTSSRSRPRRGRSARRSPARRPAR